MISERWTRRRSTGRLAENRASRSQLRALALTAFLVAVGGAAPPAAAVGPEWLVLRNELLYEHTTTGDTDDSLLNPGGELESVDSNIEVVRLDSDFSILPAGGWSFKGKLTYLLTDVEKVEDSFDVREAYANGDLGPFDLSIGRKIHRWSNGYAYSPAGLLDPVRSPTDPGDRLSQNRGRDLVELELYRGAHTFSAIFSSDDLFRGETDSLETVLALRYNVFVAGVDLSVMAALRPNRKDTGAFSLSYVANDRMEIHAELAVREGSDALFPRTIEGGMQQTLFGQDYFAAIKSEISDLFLEYLLGINYTFSGGINLIAEYYHSDEGLSSREWDLYLQQGRFSRDLADSQDFAPVFDGRSAPEIDLLQALQALNRTSVGRNYLFMRAALPQRSWRKLESSLIALVNLQDRSWVAIPEASLSISRRLEAYARATVFFGDSRSEFGLVPTGPSANIGLRVRF